MIAADLVRFGVFCALPFATSAGQIVALAAVAGFATGFFRPAVYAGLPNLVEDDELPSAQGLLQAADAMTTVLGPLAGGVLVAATSPDWAYAINAITFLFSAALILRIPARLLQAAQAATEGHWRDVAEGLKLIGSSRALLTVLIAWNVGMLGQRRRERRGGRARQGLVRRRRLRVRAHARERGLRARLRQPQRRAPGSSIASLRSSTARGSG